MAQFGQVAWHSPGAAIGPDSSPEVSLGVVRCHLGDPGDLLDIVGPSGGTSGASPLSCARQAFGGHPASIVPAAYSSVPKTGQNRRTSRPHLALRGTTWHYVAQGAPYMYAYMRVRRTSGIATSCVRCSDRGRKSQALLRDTGSCVGREPWGRAANGSACSRLTPSRAQDLNPARLRGIRTLAQRLRPSPPHPGNELSQLLDFLEARTRKFNGC